MRFATNVLLALVLVTGLSPAVALGQVFTNDPEAGSPSGTIYEIPLDDGRKDAAPRSGGGGDGGGGANGGGTTGTGGSPIHSENNFGSSSTVPGTEGAAAQAGGAAAGSSAGSRDRASGREDDAKDEAARKGEKRGDGLTAAQERAARVNAASVAPGPSMTRAMLLIGLGIAVAVGLGVAAARLAPGRR